MNVAIVKYNAGNIYSIHYALKRLGVEPIITAEKELLQKADKIVFPGQGEAVKTMQYLKRHRLNELIKELKQPVLGICIGMQLMCRCSEEGNVNCLGIFDTPVLKFQPEKHEDKIPHMGWNTLTNLKNYLYEGIKEESFVYFVHSFYVPASKYTIAITNYIQPFSASLQKDNFYATQFHPEKSGKVGEKILSNFLSL
ncbi:MAG: imidazole glycerol phosphate synthase subunit HisH [Candidatus Azobacteroides pseudotrichonymphae]|uniref:Imidazole glycerol phosphate synthase subunit HisH n=1 Tax=Azobacteroides pseudotrichonymphae genomovar. CFP2 TaxID=511995 RepID=B6YQ28_AZOPC|nr:imidazole glycerol phosphate synthase subunit HisH [Candidatus Azobacteroides pseudotrichonymphae]MDR0530065.1 imidazole glycerol phosphate synthase subunit HisH [Bacteroidales bacterium OttesenSCG-928-I14]BAG83300.1 imidazole glycerol phosphate synthase glutamine amidotransferase subunit [Candidatus Azobacteroides pseudotrichonymphae genomovar. CFP2]GMO33320.1 MAG: imidazole glycerol phosphate synthase subunit HisH [Candidatus Azobacteroides pseudotrichonymphae]